MRCGEIGVIEVVQVDGIMLGLLTDAVKYSGCWIYYSAFVEC